MPPVGSVSRTARRVGERLLDQHLAVGVQNVIRDEGDGHFGPQGVGQSLAAQALLQLKEWESQVALHGDDLAVEDEAGGDAGPEEGRESQKGKKKGGHVGPPLRA